MKDPNRVFYYEWDVESIDPVSGDVLDHDHRNTFADCWPCFGDENTIIVLVKTWDNFQTQQHGRSWAYLQEDGTLPGCFQNGSTVPQRFHKEVQKVRK